jgi:hypothetical protein
MIFGIRLKDSFDMPVARLPLSALRRVCSWNGPITAPDDSLDHLGRGALARRWWSIKELVASINHKDLEILLDAI